MKETKAKKSTYLRNFIIAVALSAAILAAGALWVLLSWRSALDITLTDLAGDPAALRGFTMRGQSYFDTAHTLGPARRLPGHQLRPRPRRER